MTDQGRPRPARMSAYATAPSYLALLSGLALERVVDRAPRVSRDERHVCQSALPVRDRYDAVWLAADAGLGPSTPVAVTGGGTVTLAH